MTPAPATWPMTAPPGACDTHVHVIGPQADYPMVADRHYTPAPASVAQLLAHLDGLGLQRAVIVQPSVYGTDNRCLSDSLAACAGRARGVAVLAPDVPQAELQRLHAAGVRGLRINHESSGQRDTAGLVRALQTWADRLRGLPWHLQVYAQLDVLAEAAPALRDLGLPVVLDHFAMAPATLAEDDPRWPALRDWLAGGGAYLKLSAPYRIAGSAGQAQQVAALARRLLAVNPQRLLWASDWPHTHRDPGKGPLEVSSYRPMPAQVLRDQWPAWLPEAHRAQVLSANPAALYGF